MFGLEQPVRLRARVGVAPVATRPAVLAHQVVHAGFERRQPRARRRVALVKPGIRAFDFV